MYKCNKCNKTFEESRTIYESVPYGSTNVDYPVDEVCPCCGSDDFEEVEACKICGTNINRSYRPYRLCPDCYGDVSHKMKTLIDNLKAHGVDLDILDDLIERNC